MKKLFFFSMMMSLAFISKGQAFKIGTTQGYASWSQYDANGYGNWQNPLAVINTNSMVSGHNSSAMNVLKEDGFDLVEIYWPDNSLTIANYANFAKLVKANGMQLVDHFGYWYRTNGASPCANCPGTIQFNAAPPDRRYVGSNYDTLFKPDDNGVPLMYGGDMSMASTFYMHDLGTEFNCFHYCPIPNFSPWYCDNLWYKCWGGGYNTSNSCETGGYFHAAEVSPQSLSDAINYLKNTYPNIHHPISVGLATHGSFVKDAFRNDGCFNSSPYNGVFNPQNYVKYSTINPPYTVTNPRTADIINEDSYYGDNFKNWANTTDLYIGDGYLGKFKNIDYLHAAGYSHIISEYDAAGETAQSIYQLHSNPARQNGNMIRFLVYTSIIHGIDGINFYTLDQMYAKSPDVVWDPDNLDQVNFPALDHGGSSATRFNRPNFPYIYKNYISKMTRELRYLANNGTVKPNNTNVLYSKLGNSLSADPNGIVEASTNYLPQTILSADIGDYNAINGFSGNFNNNPKRTEYYGIQYLITTNTNGDVTMIASNPNPYSVHNVHFSFSQLNNSAINNAKCVDVLFDDGLVNDVNASNYKTDVSYSVDIGPSFNLLKKYSLPFCNKTITSDFGPFDVKIFYFNRQANTGNPAYTVSGWTKQWSNNQDGTIGTWGGVNNLNSSDKFIPIDFDGDGDDELLCVQSKNSDGPGGPNPDAWATVLDYNNHNNGSNPYTWTNTYSNSSAIWTNNGNGSFNRTFGGWATTTADKYIVGDFDGDGYNNDFLCINGSWAVMFHVSPNPSHTIPNIDFTWYWSNNGNGNLRAAGGAWTLNATDKFQVGDFNGDGKNNELLCVRGTNNGAWAILHFSPNPGSDFSSYWSGTGSLMNNWTIGANDQFITGNYDGVNGRNEVLCMERGAGMRISSIKKNLSALTSTVEWSVTNGNIGGWGIPLLSGDPVLAGDVETNDLKDEMMFINRCTNCSYATTEDYDTINHVPQWNWSNHNGGFPVATQNYIGDWLVNDNCANDVKYLFVKADNATKNSLLAFKSYTIGSNTAYLISMYKTNASYNYRMVPAVENMQPGDDMNSNTFDFKLYPNPNTGSFTLSSGTTSDKQVIVTDVTGRVIYRDTFSDTDFLITLPYGSKGIYFVKLIDGDKTGMRKVVIE